MVTEIAEFTVDDADGFVAAYRTVRHHLEDAGATGVAMHRGVESPRRFVLLARWPSVAVHQSFRDGTTYRDWRAAIGPFFAADPVVEHVTSAD